jgi:hypothetical protein
MLGLLVPQVFRSHAVDRDTHRQGPDTGAALIDREHGGGAGMLEDHHRRQHIIGDRDPREELIRQLKARGIAFDATFANVEAERKEHLERAFPPAADQWSRGWPANYE